MTKCNVNQYVNLNSIFNNFIYLSNNANISIFILINFVYLSNLKSKIISN